MLNVILMIPINVVTKTMIINYNVLQAYDPENVYIIGMLSKKYTKRSNISNFILTFLYSYKIFFNHTFTL